MSETFITFKLPVHLRRDVGEWLAKNKIIDDVTYDWVKGILTFGIEADANAFALKFGLLRYETTIEKMLKNEESYN